MVELNCDQLSAIFGWISMGCWIVVYCPQMIENYRLQSGEGLSLLFLTAWITGDICNLSGVIIGGLMPSVISLGVYFLLSDLFLLAQVYYYRWKRSRYPIGPLYDTPTPNTSIFASGHGYEGRDCECESEYDYNYLAYDSDIERTPILSYRRRRKRNGIGDSEEQDTLLRVIIRSILCLVVISIAGAVAWWVDESYFGGGGAIGGSGDIAEEGMGMKQLMENWIRIIPGGDFDSEKGTWGNLEWLKGVAVHVLGWTGATLYICSNLPQILKNFRTKCEGLSPSLYVFMMFGSCTYVLSIITKSLDKDYLVKNAGWLARHVIPSFLDCVVIGQILYYRYTERGRRSTYTALL